MFDQFLRKSAELVAQGEPFATATVVRCQPPTSGKPGDKAIIHADGRIWGWIGGGCAQPVVIKEALRALAEGVPKLVRISPSPNDPEEGTVDYTMTCHSGGSLDIYIEPVLPRPQLVILGRSPVARILAQLSSTIGYAVSIVSADPVSDVSSARVVLAQDFSLADLPVTTQTFIVVSTQGEGDEEALEQALKSNAGYIAFVASKTKADKVFSDLRQRGTAGERISQVHAPAGLEIGARSPEEIAVSILAQIVQMRAKVANLPVRESLAAEHEVSAEAKDPICGMTVRTSGARYSTEHGGAKFYFCCAGCKQTFERDPQRYLAVAHP